VHFVFDPLLAHDFFHLVHAITIQYYQAKLVLINTNRPN
jgi:hypothetical protein